jgi:ribosomal protein L37AE/L43A
MSKQRMKCKKCGSKLFRIVAELTDIQVCCNKCKVVFVGFKQKVDTPELKLPQGNTTPVEETTDGSSGNKE